MDIDIICKLLLEFLFPHFLFFLFFFRSHNVRIFTNIRITEIENTFAIQYDSKIIIINNRLIDRKIYLSENKHVCNNDVY